MQRAERDRTRGEGSLPVAMAAVSVDGRCRERNPPDQAIFGPESDRLVPRFCDPSEGQALFARCTEAGTAEGTATLETVAGRQCFRISLWRQRGGERIRILAAFAAAEGEGPCADDARPAGVSSAHGVTSAQEMIGRALRGPVESVIAVAGALRLAGSASEGTSGGGAGDIARAASLLLTAGWRLTRLCDDLSLLGELRSPRLPVRTAEVDVSRLIRRVQAVAASRVGSAGLDAAGFGASHPGPLVMTDEGALWTLLDQLATTVPATGKGGDVAPARIWLDDTAPGDGVSIIVGTTADTGADGSVSAMPDGDCEQLADTCGARLEPGRVKGVGPVTRVVFPPARCLGPA